MFGQVFCMMIVGTNISIHTLLFPIYLKKLPYQCNAKKSPTSLFELEINGGKEKQIWGAGCTQAHWQGCRSCVGLHIITACHPPCTKVYAPSQIREAILKKSVFFRALPERGWRPLPEFFYPFFHHVFPYILTSISCYLIFFLVIFNTKIIKSTKILITIITHTIVVIIVTWFCNTR